MTAASFERAIQRLKTPAIGSGGAAYAADISSFAAVGNTLTINLSAPDAGLPHRLATPFFCAVPSDVPMGAQAAGPIGSAGPYYVSSITPTQIVVERNPHYGGSRIRNIGTFVYQLDPPNRVTSTLAGTTDLAPFLGTPEVQSISLPEPRLTSSPSNGVFHLALNTSTAPFNVQSVRQAASYAVDRTAASALRGWIPTDQMLAPTMPGYQDASLYPLTAQTTTAQGLLAGATPAIRLCYQGAQNQPVASVLKSNLESAGFVVTLAPTSFNGLLVSANCEASLFGWVPEYTDGESALTPILAGSGTSIPRTSRVQTRRSRPPARPSTRSRAPTPTARSTSTSPATRRRWRISA